MGNLACVAAISIDNTSAHPLLHIMGLQGHPEFTVSLNKHAIKVLRTEPDKASITITAQWYRLSPNVETVISTETLFFIAANS